jgi:hypothetical protein
MVFTKLGMAGRTRQVGSDFEVLDTDEAFGKVNILNCNPKGFGDAASQVKQDPNK